MLCATEWKFTNEQTCVEKTLCVQGDYSMAVCCQSDTKMEMQLQAAAKERVPQKRE